ncbi:fibronectin type III domain-containing protein [Longibacter sp.]|jgi:fibronectin type 3 domain-containing protein|uniref:fibronectin type III domain-containing protein n=1 Tax=Longibacter sp. TaxID=2045415 RepID=UPI003EB96D4C
MNMLLRAVHRTFMLPRLVLVIVLAALLVPVTGCDGGGENDTPPPPSPVRLSAEQVSAGISLTWDSNAPGETDGYNVYRATDAEATADGTPLNGSPVSDLSFVDDTVADGMVYSYAVTSVGPGGESRASSAITVRYFPDPPTRP